MKAARRIWGVCFGVVVAFFSIVSADPSAPTSLPANPSELSAAKNWTAAQDHQNMMEQLGIKSLRPGPSGNENAPNHANYDESKANPFLDLPDVLTTRDGKKVTT